MSISRAARGVQGAKQNAPLQRLCHPAAGARAAQQTGTRISRCSRHTERVTLGRRRVQNGGPTDRNEASQAVRDPAVRCCGTHCFPEFAIKPNTRKKRRENNLEICSSPLFYEVLLL